MCNDKPNLSLYGRKTTKWPDVWAPDDYPFMQLMIDQSIKNANESLFLVTSVRNITIVDVAVYTTVVILHVLIVFQ